MDLQRRPMRTDDAHRWAGLLAAVEEADQRGEHYDDEDCLDELTDPEVDLARDSCLVLDGDEPVAYQVLQLRTGGLGGARLVSDAAVHPTYRRRGIGTSLVARGQQRAAEHAAALEQDVALNLKLAENNTGGAALAQRCGLVPVRWWSDMRRDLAEPVVPAPLPAGLTLQPLGPDFDADRWDERLRAAHNAAFADHWGSSAVSPESWAHWYTGGRAFRGGCSVAACDGDGAVAGYVFGCEYEADTVRTGVRELYIALVGTVAPWRGRGLAGALLAHVLAAGAGAGYERSAITVDAHNPTGALGVYARAGFALTRRDITYAPPA